MTMNIDYAKCVRYAMLGFVLVMAVAIAAS